MAQCPVRGALSPIADAVVATEPAGINLEDIKRLVVERQFDEALRRLDVLLGSQPDHPDALYMSAVCCRYRRDFEAALGP